MNYTNEETQFISVENLQVGSVYYIHIKVEDGVLRQNLPPVNTYNRLYVKILENDNGLLKYKFIDLLRNEDEDLFDRNIITTNTYQPNRTIEDIKYFFEHHYKHAEENQSNIRRYTHNLFQNVYYYRNMLETYLTQLDITNDQNLRGVMDTQINQINDFIQNYEDILKNYENALVEQLNLSSNGTHFLGIIDTQIPNDVGSLIKNPISSALYRAIQYEFVVSLISVSFSEIYTENLLGGKGKRRKRRRNKKKHHTVIIKKQKNKNIRKIRKKTLKNK